MTATSDTWTATPIFRFVWLIRGHVDVQHVIHNPKAAIVLVERVIGAWSASSKVHPPYGRNGDAWLDWFGLGSMDAHAEFIDVWTKSRFKPGHDPLEQAIDAARQLRLLPNAETMAKRPDDYARFISIAGHLQVVMGDQPIFLPCRKLAAKMGVSDMTVSRYRRWAVEDGFLQTVKHAQFRSGGRSDATEFRFAVDRFKALAERAQQ